MRLLASGRGPHIRSGRLRSRPVRRVRIGNGGPCQAGRCRFRYRQVLRPRPAPTSTTCHRRAQLRFHRRVTRHELDVVGFRRGTRNRHGQRPRVPAQLCRGHPAVQSDRRTRVEPGHPDNVGMPAECAVLLRHDDRISEGRSALDHTGHELVPGTDFVTVDGMPAVHFSGLTPTCAPL